MTKAMSRRLERVQERLAPQDGSNPLTHLLNDELEILLLDTSAQILEEGGPELDEERAKELRDRVSRIRGAIIATARKQASPEYQRHQEWLSATWRKRSNGSGYVCSLFDIESGYDDWDRPDVMRRRQALRERPDIAALIDCGNKPVVSSDLAKLEP